MPLLHFPSFTKALNETTSVNPMDITKKIAVIPKQTLMHTSMFTYEQCIQKLLTTQRLNAPIIQRLKEWLKQHKQITKC